MKCWLIHFAWKACLNGHTKAGKKTLAYRRTLGLLKCADNSTNTKKNRNKTKKKDWEKNMKTKKRKKYIYIWEKPISHQPSAHLRFTTSTHQRNCWSTLGISKSNELLDVLMTLNLQNLLNKEVIRKTKLTIFVFSILCMEGCFLSFSPMGPFGLVVPCMYLVPLRWIFCWPLIGP